MPSIMDWGLGLVVGYLVLQFGNIALPILGLGVFGDFILSAALLVVAVMLAWRFAYRGE